MRKVVMLFAFAIAIAFGLAQEEAERTLQEAITNVPEDAEVALYSHDPVALVGYSADFTRADFQLTLEQGFTGPATLLIQHTEEKMLETYAVEVVDGAIMHEGTSLVDILTQAGFENAQIVVQEQLTDEMRTNAPPPPEGALEVDGGEEASGAEGGGEVPGEDDGAEDDDEDGGEGDGGDEGAGN